MRAKCFVWFKYRGSDLPPSRHPVRNRETLSWDRPIWAIDDLLARVVSGLPVTTLVTIPAIAMKSADCIGSQRPQSRELLRYVKQCQTYVIDYHFSKF